MDGENQMPDEGCDSESQQNGLVKNSLQDIQMKNNGEPMQFLRYIILVRSTFKQFKQKIVNIN